MRKRKTNYPPAKTATRQPQAQPGDPAYVRSTVAAINVDAKVGRPGLAVGHRVRLGGSGPYSGEIVTIEKMITGGVISQVIIRTDGGQTRRVRTIDLESAAG